MNSQELNAKIRDLKGYVLYQSPTGWYRWWIPTPLYSPTSGWSNLDSATRDLPDWTGEEGASATLLEELPQPHIWKNPNGEWTCEILLLTPENKAMALAPDEEFCISNLDRKTAIALAWLEWKTTEKA